MPPGQMGVSVTALTAPAPEDLRAKLMRLGTDLPAVGPATPYEPGGTDLAPFDSVPGAGFDTSPTAAVILAPPAGSIIGAGPALALDPGAEQHVRRFEPGVGHGGRAGAVFRCLKYLRDGRCSGCARSAPWQLPPHATW